MTRTAAVVIDDRLRIPRDVGSLAEFRRWTHSAAFPEDRRVDFVAGDVEVEMSPEDLYTHGVVKTAIAVALHEWVVRPELGNVFIDRTRLSSGEGDLSVEPDLVVVLWSSIESGRLREVPAAAGAEGRFVELDGAADLVVEIVSDGSVHKDLERLPALYARAGVGELWTVDARGAELKTAIGHLEDRRYRAAVPDPEGWTRSLVLERSVRLARRRGRLDRWCYELAGRVA